MTTTFPLQRHMTSAVRSFTGEDGDFIQLQIEREKMMRFRELSKQMAIMDPSAQSSTDNSGTLSSKGKGQRLEVKHDGKSTGPRRLSNFMGIRSSKEKTKWDSGRDRLDGETLQKKLFKAIEEFNLEKFNKKRTKYGLTSPLETVRDPKTDMNVLHYALEMKCVVIATFLIQEGNMDLIRSTYTIQQSGIIANVNILHILIRKGDKDMLEWVLDQIGDTEIAKEMFRMEIIVQLEDHRIRLLPCLHMAAYYGYTPLVEVILDRTGLIVDTLNSKNETALMWASRQGHTETSQALIKRGSNVNLENDKGTTAFYWAVRYGRLEVAKLLIEEGKADPHKTRKIGLVSPLIVASAYGNVEMVKLLLGQPGGQVNLRIRGGGSAMHYATREGYTDIVNLLLEYGATPDDPDDVGDTPLLLAAKYGHVELANILINNGARVGHRNHEGHDIWRYGIDCEGDDLLETLVIATQEMLDPYRQPMCIAASMGKIDKIDFMIRLGLDTRATDKDGNSFIHFAAMYDHHGIIRKYPNQDMLDLQNKNGNTAFHIACYRGYESTIRTLTELKAKPGIKNNKGETVLHSAAYSQDITAESVTLLTEYTMKDHSWDILNQRDYQGNNCLHIVAKHGTPDVIWEFREVSIKDQDRDGMTPLHNAVRSGEPAVLDTMMDIFELARRDARINEQTTLLRETVLHLAAEECLTESMKRLVHLGADISEKDCNGNTVLHRLILACVQDSQSKLQYLDVFDAILDQVVTWWCVKNQLSTPYESDRELITKYREEAVLNISRNILNNNGMSVVDLAFAVGCSDVLSRLLMMQGVTYFVTEEEGVHSHVFDITGLMPRTKRADIRNRGSSLPRRSSARRQTKKSGGLELEEVTEFINHIPEPETKVKKLSGMDWLMTCTDNMKTGEILDLPPVQIIEKHFVSIVGWTFTVLLFLHVVYMSIFTYVGIEVQSSIKQNNFSMTISTLLRAKSGVLCFVVPLEPLVIFVFFIYLLIRYCCTGDIKRRIQLSKAQSIGTVFSVIKEYTLPFIYFSFAILVFLWIILLKSGYTYQDYVLAVAICSGWLLAISFTRGIKMVHYFYKMLLNIIIRDVFRFLLVYMFVLLAISLAIHVLFQASDDMSRVYKTPGSTIFLTFNLMMGMGELFDDNLDERLESVNRSSDMIKSFYLLYIVLGSLVMLNVLIAMMNDSYSRVLRQGSTTWRIESIRIGMEIERSISISRIFSTVSTTYGPLGSQPMERWSVTISDSDIQSYFKTLERKALQPDTLTKRMDIIEQRTVTIEKLLTQNLQQITEALQQKKKKKKLLKKRFGLFGKGLDGGKIGGNDGE